MQIFIPNVFWIFFVLLDALVISALMAIATFSGNYIRLNSSSKTFRNIFPKSV